MIKYKYANYNQGWESQGFCFDPPPSRKVLPKLMEARAELQVKKPFACASSLILCMCSKALGKDDDDDEDDDDDDYDFCLFDLILYVHSTIFQLCGTVFLGWTSTKLG